MMEQSSSQRNRDHLSVDWRRWWRLSDWPILWRIMAGMITLLVLALSISAWVNVVTIGSSIRQKTGDQFQVLARSQLVQVADFLSENLSILQSISLLNDVQKQALVSNGRYQGTSVEIEARLLALDVQWQQASGQDPLVQRIINAQLNPLSAQLMRYIQTYPGYVEIFFTDRHGALLAATSYTSDYYQADEEWWQAAFNQGQGALFISQPAYDESTGILGVQMAAPILDSSGEVIGVVRSTLRIDQIEETMRQLELGQTGHLTVINPEGIVVADPIPSHRGRLLPASWRTADILSRPLGWALLTDFENNRVMVGYAAISLYKTYHVQDDAAIQKLGWVLFVQQSQEEALGLSARTVTLSLAVTGFFVLAASVLSWLLARSVAQPILQLAEVARQISAGNLRARVPFRRRDEVGDLATSFEHMAKQVADTVGTLEQRVSERTGNLEAAARIAAVVTSVLDQDELQHQAVELIRENFNLYYAGLFLIDQTGEWTRPFTGQNEPNKWVILRVGTGEPGRVMADRGHRFLIGDPNSMIGRCVGQRQAIIALDVGEEPYRFNNPLLPDTHSEMALPLVSRDRVLGALTIQSDRVAAFSQAEITTMQTMADQIAGAIDNAQSFAAAQDALARSEAVVRRYVQESWERFVETNPVSGYVYDAGAVRPTRDAWLSAMDRAVQSKDLVVNSEAGDLALPLVLSGEVIGSIGLRRRVDEPWSPDEVALVQAVGQQVAQAVETRRLFEETRQNARRETILRQTTERARSQANLDALLRVAVQEIQRAVGASHVAIRLVGEGAPETPGQRGGGGTQNA